VSPGILVAGHVERTVPMSGVRRLATDVALEVGPAPGEGRAWEGTGHALLLVDILGEPVHGYGPPTDERREWHVGRRVGRVVPTTAALSWPRTTASRAGRRPATKGSLWGGDRRRLSSRTGRPEERGLPARVELRLPRVDSIAFGGEQMDQLYVTGAGGAWPRRHRSRPACGRPARRHGGCVGTGRVPVRRTFDRAAFCSLENQRGGRASAGARRWGVAAGEPVADRDGTSTKEAP
jgi:sugar lactone lactonase YvrE